MNSTAIEVSWQKGEYKTGPTNYSVSAIDDKNNASKYSCSTEGKPTESTPVKSSAMYFLDHNLNNGDHQFHQYPQNEQSSLILDKLTEHTNITTYDV
jgi:hypothetical protein